MRKWISIGLLITLVVVIILAVKRQRDFAIADANAKKKPRIMASLKGKVVVHSAVSIPKNKTPEPETEVPNPTEQLQEMFETASDKEGRKCLLLCALKHPLNKNKRNDCIAEC